MVSWAADEESPVGSASSAERGRSVRCVRYDAYSGFDKTDGEIDPDKSSDSDAVSTSLAATGSATVAMRGHFKS